MRYLFGFLCVCALAGTVPPNASAQAGESATTSEPNLEQPAAPSSEPAPEEPALQLKLDDAGVDVVPSPLRTADGYTLEEMNVRVKRARIGLGVSVVSFVVGTAAALGAGAASICLDLFDEPCSPPGWAAPVIVTGSLMAVGGLGGTIASGTRLREQKRKLQEAHYGTPRRVQWDLAQSRVVF